MNHMLPCMWNVHKYAGFSNSELILRIFHLLKFNALNIHDFLSKTMKKYLKLSNLQGKFYFLTAYSFLFYEK